MQSLTAGMDSGTISIKVVDAYGNTVGSELIDLSSNAGTGKFYANSSSTTAIASVTTASNGTASFVYYDTVVGTPTVTAMDDANHSVVKTQQETVTNAAAATITFTTNPQSLTAGMDSGTISIKVVDAYGNAVGSELIDLSSNAGTGKFYANSGSTTAITSVTTASNGTVSFVYYDTIVGTPTITAMDDANHSVVKTQQETVTNAAAATITFSTNPQSLTAGTDSGTISIKVVDAYGNNVGSEQINLSSSAGTGKFYANSGSTTPITSVTTASNGTASFVYYDTIVGTPIVTATDNANHSVLKTQQETVTTASAATITFTTNPQSLTAGTDSGTISIKVVDAYGNTVGSELIDLSSNAGTGKFYANSGSTTAITSVTTASNGTASFVYYDTVVGTPTVTAIDDANHSVVKTQQETVTAATPVKIMFTTTAMGLTAGTTTGTITIAVADANGNTVAESGDTITLQSNFSTGIFYASASSTTPISFITTNSSGTASFVYYDTTAGTPTITATDANKHLTTHTATQQETVTALSAPTPSARAAPSRPAAATTRPRLAGAASRVPVAIRSPWSIRPPTRLLPPTPTSAALL